MVQVRRQQAAFLILIAMAGCSPRSEIAGVPSSAAKTPQHVHGTGPNGGMTFDFGNYHGEFVIDQGKREVAVFILAEDEKTPQPVSAAKLDLTVKSPSIAIELKPMPTVTDPPGKSSRFVGTHDDLAKNKELDVTVTAKLDNKPSVGQFKASSEKLAHGKMPQGVGGTPAELKLFLEPGGLYTKADIEANGNTVPSIKYRGISWPHDDDLKPGDKVCPVTANKADTRCKWIVNGQTYEFCCTPCLDKFVKWAKEQPDKIKEPSAYTYK